MHIHLLYDRDLLKDFIRFMEMLFNWITFFLFYLSWPSNIVKNYDLIYFIYWDDDDFCFIYYYIIWLCCDKYFSICGVYYWFLIKINRMLSSRLYYYFARILIELSFIILIQNENWNNLRVLLGSWEKLRNNWLWEWSIIVFGV